MSDSQKRPEEIDLEGLRAAINQAHPDIERERVSPEVVRIAKLNAERVMAVAEVTASTREQIKKVRAATKRSEIFAKVMDTGMVDPLIGLIPGIGDLVSAGAGFYIVAEAINAGVSKWKIFKMLVNIGIDLGVGTIPIVGDIADFFFRSNKRNAKIMRDHLAELEKS